MGDIFFGSFPLFVLCMSQLTEAGNRASHWRIRAIKNLLKIFLKNILKINV